MNMNELKRKGGWELSILSFHICIWLFKSGFRSVLDIDIDLWKGPEWKFKAFSN